jgi:hypothetical protein
MHPDLGAGRPLDDRACRKLEPARSFDFPIQAHFRPAGETHRPSVRASFAEIEFHVTPTKSSCGV